MSVCQADLPGEVLRVLDVGCGTGHLLRVLATLFPRALCVGVDPASTMLEQAAHLTNAVLVQADVESLPFADASFDVVTATLSVRHWSDPDRGLREIGRVLAPGGMFGLADALPVERHSAMRRMIGRRRGLRAPTAAALREAGLRPANVSISDGFGPVPEIALVVCRKPLGVPATL